MEQKTYFEDNSMKMFDVRHLSGIRFILEGLGKVFIVQRSEKISNSDIVEDPLKEMAGNLKNFAERGIRSVSNKISLKVLEEK